MRFMTLNCSGDYTEIEAIIRLTRSGYRFIEVPTSMRERIAGKSMFTPFRATYFVIRSLMALMISVLGTPNCRRVNPSCMEENDDTVTAVDSRGN
jgi:hypothetical protein